MAGGYLGVCLAKSNIWLLFINASFCALYFRSAFYTSSVPFRRIYPAYNSLASAYDQNID